MYKSEIWESALIEFSILSVGPPTGGWCRTGVENKTAGLILHVSHMPADDSLVQSGDRDSAQGFDLDLFEY
jgi:hypothetical protein